MGAAILLVVVVGGIAIHLLESDRVVTVWDGFWLVLTTLTTVGYGDLTPVTLAGRVLTGTVMLLGLGTFATVAILIAEMLFERDIERDELRLERIERKLDELAERIEGGDGARPPPHRSSPLAKVDGNEAQGRTVPVGCALAAPSATNVNGTAPRACPSRRSREASRGTSSRVPACCRR